MKIRLDPQVLTRYPNATIGYLLAEVSVAKSHPHVEVMKEALPAELSKFGFNATNFVTHPNIAIWRSIYQEEFQVKAKTYRSSVESLVKRVITGKGMWHISSVVDLYNCCSVMSLLPIGGYDVDKIHGDITIRYGKEGETFRGLGSRELINVKSNQIVYADDKQVLCWLWNYNDAEATRIDEETKRVLFFIDSVVEEEAAVIDALDLLSKNIAHIGGVSLKQGVLKKNDSESAL